ncbi:hypothetical protein [Nesterenkonia haasae]|uniref:hypothetical protein n=1 Tax=Nesterenkonia haasae TaxID=2587813 RepID=UPI001391226A|nr:hypothetical protein [Nesterenkonia haasae]NDK31125.1 hypothetical protein [Nesterenkonia haasae]
MSASNTHQSEDPKGTGQPGSPADSQLSTDDVASSPESPSKPARSTTTMLAIFALICVGLLLFLLIGEIGIFETGN